MNARTILLLSSVVACCATFAAETNAPTSASPAAPAAVAPGSTATAEAAPAPATADKATAAEEATGQAAATADSNASSANTAQTNAPAADAAATATADAAVPANETAAAVPGDANATTNPPPALDGTNSLADQIIPLVEVEAALPEAVQLLARQAGINFQFDPRLMNQTGPNGQPVVPPSVKIRWEKVTASQALNALLDNYNWQLIQDPKTKIGRIVAKDPNREPLVTKVFQLKYSSPTNIMAGLRLTLSKESQLIPDMRTSQLVVMTTEKELPGIEALIEKLDTATRQILIEGKIVETTKNPKTMKGIDWSDTLEKQNFTFGNGVTEGTTVERNTTVEVPGRTMGTGQSYPGTSAAARSITTTLTTLTGNGGLSVDTARGFHPSTAFLNADGVHAVLSFLNTDAETESIALPRTVALDGVPTELSVIRNVPVFEQQQSAGTAGQNNLISARPNYELKVKETIINEVGVKLAVTPRIVGSTNVFLDLQPEISAQEVIPASFVLGGERNEAPIFSRRKIVTQATVPSGYTLVLGGLNNDNTQKSFKKVPFFGDIPGIGLLFRHDTKERTHQNLLIFVTPTIVADADFQLTPTDFLKTKFIPKPDVEESPWDTGKPADWTKPKNKVEPAYEPKSRR